MTHPLLGLAVSRRNRRSGSTSWRRAWPGGRRETSTPNSHIRSTQPRNGQEIAEALLGCHGRKYVRERSEDLQSLQAPLTPTPPRRFGGLPVGPVFGVGSGRGGHTSSSRARASTKPEGTVVSVSSR